MSKSVGSRKPLVKSTSIRVKPMQRSVILFNSALKSEQTKKLYTFTLNKFREYFIIKDYDSLGEPPPQQMELIVDLCDWFIPEYPQFLR